MIVGALSIPIQVTASDWGGVLPELIVGGGVLVLLLADAFLPRRAVEICSWLAFLALSGGFAATAYIFFEGNGTPYNFYGQVSSDKFALFFNFVILISGMLAVLLSPDYIEHSHFDAGEFYALLLAATCGMMLMAASQSLIMIFLSLELLSLALYILSGFERSRRRSQEAGFKYFLLSSFASAFLLYGMALVYGATGSTHLKIINICLVGANAACGVGTAGSPLLFIGIGLMVVGFAFKVSVVPFHMWTPDVYEGAPTPVTAFMSVTTKAAVFAAFVRVFNFALGPVETHWYGLVWALSIATMVIGNVVALSQTNMKRLLAYSGIAHAGYVLVAVAANSSFGETAVAYYFLAYAFMNIGAFILVAVLEARGEAGDEIASYRGLFARSPSLAIPMAVFMFSLAGFPPTAGFFAKYIAFSAAVRAGHTDLAIIGVLTSLISIFYYLRVVYVMFFLKPETEPGEEPVIPGLADLAMALTVAGSIGLGILPTGFFNLATQAVDAIHAAFS